MLEQQYKGKETKYFGSCRKDILPFIPKHVSRILDIGCGSGDTLAYLKANNYCNYTYGVELVHEAADVAAKRVDKLYRSNIEEMNLDLKAESIDLILCLDVLEHLINPYQLIHYLHTILTPNGSIIASIPNIRHYSASLPLFLMNKWEYKKSGILDDTHLRFFVRDTAIELMQGSGLQLEYVIGLIPGRKSLLLNRASLGIFESFLTLQYLIKVTKVVPM